MTLTDGIILLMISALFTWIIVSRLLQPKGCQCQQIKHLARLSQHYRKLKKKEINKIF
jgi:hypothetical protein